MIKLRILLVSVFLFAFGRRIFQIPLKWILQLVTHAMGYDNYWSPTASGEKYFLQRLAGISPVFCIDIGANVGNYSRELLKVTNARVVAFEPLPSTFELLLEVKEEFNDRFFPQNFGVGAEESILELHHSDGASEHASFSSEISSVEYVTNEKVSEVPVITLDLFMKREFPQIDEIDFIKIDTEGFEVEVLRGAQETISKLRPKVLQIEFNWHQLFRSGSIWTMSEMLPEYKVYQLLPYRGGFQPRDPKQPNSNFFKFSNYVFVRSDITL